MEKRIILVLLVAICLSGCRSSEYAESTRTDLGLDSEQYELMDEYTKKDGNVEVSCDIIVPDESIPALHLMKARCQKVEPRNVFRYFAPEISTDEIIEYDNAYDEYGRQAKTYTYYNPDNENFYLNVGPTSSSFCFQHGDLLGYINSSFNLEKRNPEYNGDKFSLTREFDFMTRDEAQKKIQEALSNTGLDGDFNYKIYALDHETLSEYEYHNNHDGSEARDKYKDAWTKDDDAYYVCARQTYDGVPVFHMFLGAFAEEEDDKTPITAIISSSGFLYFGTEQVFEFYDKKSVKEIASMDDVLQVVFDKYGQILTDKHYLFHVAELEYFVDVKNGNGEYNAVPCWIIKGVEVESGNEVQVVVNACTAKEIAL